MDGSGSDTAEREALKPDTGERTVWLDTGESPAVVPETGEYGELDGDTYEREATERDTTDEWRIQPAAIGTVAQLEARIGVALATAQAAEEAALEIGTASREAAEQARRAAALAERASAAAARAAGEASTAAASAERSREAATTAALAERDAPEATELAVNRPSAADFLPRPDAGPAPRRPDPFEERFSAFRLRAEKVMIRLQKLEAGADPGDGPSEVVRLR